MISTIKVRQKYVESKVYIWLKYSKSTVKYGKSTVLYGNFFGAYCTYSRERLLAYCCGWSSACCGDAEKNLVLKRKSGPSRTSSGWPRGRIECWRSEEYLR